MFDVIEVLNLVQEVDFLVFISLFIANSRSSQTLYKDGKDKLDFKGSIIQVFLERYIYK